MTTPQIQADGVLKILATIDFLMVACDPDTYATKQVKGAEIVAAWKSTVFSPPSDAPGREVVAFESYADDPSNWMENGGIPSVLIWVANGDRCGSIRFYRLTHQVAEAQCPSGI